MNVHIVPSTTIPVEIYDQLMHLLWKYSGNIRFIKGKPVHIKKLDVEMYFEDKEKYLKKLPPPEVCHSKTRGLFDFEFPTQKKAVKWDDLFDLCKQYRIEYEISPDDQVMLISDKLNAHNWFGCTDGSLKNYFIQANDWRYIFGLDIDSRYPIAYEIASWLLRTQMFGSFEEILDNFHEFPQGCVMDYCERKTDIIFKMRTADMCPQCLHHLEVNEINSAYLRQLFAIIEGIRENLTFRARSGALKQKSRLQIRGHMMNVFLVDLGDLEVKLNPKEKALYLLYLNHPEGITRSYLVDHIDELKGYYSMLSSHSTRAQIEEAVQKMVDVTDNNMNEIMSRIRQKFRSLLGPKDAHEYSINATPEMTHTILLDRQLVTFEKD